MARAAIPLTRSGIAAKLDVSVATVSRILRDRHRPRGMSRAQMAVKLGVKPMTVYRMLNGEGPYARLYR